MTTVSIVIPCFNDGRYLPDAIASAQTQTHPNIEIVVVDDHSTDVQTLDALRVAADRGAHVLKTPEGKKGPSAARNAGIAQASGDYILPLDADDKIDPAYIATALAVFERDPDVVICGCNVRFFGLRHHRLNQPPLSMVALVLEEYKLVNSCLFRKSDWERVGGYDESLVFSREDMVFWLDLLQLGGKIHVLPDEFFFYRIRPRSLTAAVPGAASEREKLEALYAARPEHFHRHIVDFMDAVTQYRTEKAQRECLLSWKVFAPILRLEWFLRQRVKRFFGRA